MEYTATENCFVNVRLCSYNNEDTYAKIGALPVAYCKTTVAGYVYSDTLIPLKKGQTITITSPSSHGSNSYAVYKMQ